MPELPEVQTLVGQLRTRLKNKIISRVVIDDERAVVGKASLVRKILTRAKINDVRRRAKLLVIVLNNKNFVLIHLKMTGQLIFLNSQGRLTAVGGHPQQGGEVDLPNRYTKVMLTFTDGSRLFFNDVRRFGWWKVVDDLGLDEIFAKYGPEPLTGDFGHKVLAEIIKKYPGRKLKALLLDQSLIAGLGNIYVDESCYAAGLRPMRRVSTLNNREIKKLAVAIPKILRLSIKHGGTSTSDYRHSDGRKGNFQNKLKVYGRGQQVCRRCQTKIIRTVCAGRGTHYCPTCQK